MGYERIRGTRTCNLTNIILVIYVFCDSIDIFLNPIARTFNTNSRERI